MTELKDLARQYLEQAYFVGADGLLYTPFGRAARSTIRVGRTIYPAAPLIAEMQRQLRFPDASGTGLHGPYRGRETRRFS